MKPRSLLAILLAAAVTGCSGMRAPPWDDVTWNTLGWDTMYYWGVDKYEGKFDRRLNRDGPGVYTFSNGDRLSGLFRDGYVQSPAKVEFADGKTYIGGFYKNALHGRGTMTYANGDRYDGPFVKGRRHGRGVYHFATGGHYTGDFQADQLSGQGSFVYANGDAYTGQVLNGMHHGRGRQTFSGGRAALEGVWDHGAFVQLEKLR